MTSSAGAPGKEDFMNIKKIQQKKEAKPPENLRCSRCSCLLELTDVHVTYLDRHFSHKVPRCPKCGQVYITEELAEGKMAQLEKSLEEK